MEEIVFHQINAAAVGGTTLALVFLTILLQFGHSKTNFVIMALVSAVRQFFEAMITTHDLLALSFKLLRFVVN